MSVLINNRVHGRIVKAILDELARSKMQHPNYPPDPLRREAIIMEEGLEALHGMVTRLMNLQQVTLGYTRISAKDVFNRNDLKNELIQTASTCVKFLESIEAEEEAEEEANAK